jgi:hypothetical protein
MFSNPYQKAFCIYFFKLFQGKFQESVLGMQVTIVIKDMIATGISGAGIAYVRDTNIRWV